MVGSNTIGDRIKILREAKGETQADLAKALLVKRETVNQWENGARDLKTQYTISLAEHFETTCDYILRGIRSDNVSIHRKTGLSDVAIRAIVEVNEIAKLNGEKNEDGAIIALSKLLENEGFWSLLSDISWLELDYINKLLYEREMERYKSRIPPYNPAHNPILRLKERIEGKSQTLDPADYYTLAETLIKEKLIEIIRTIMNSSLEGKDLHQVKKLYDTDFEGPPERRE